MAKKELPTIGKYTLLEEIGSGGFGTVYKAHDPSLDRYVALKLLMPHLTQDATTLERFRQEAKQAARLKHPNIVTVYEVAESEGRYYIVMEYLEGQPLSEIIKEEGPLPPQRAVKITQQIGEALDYAHGEGLIHRDVKPSNILIGNNDKATLTDFGIVKAVGESGLTTTGTSMGTPEYMAPEQIAGEEPDPRTDLYALGVVAYHMLTGQVPFSGTTPYAIQKGHAEKEPPDPKEINPALGEHVVETLLKALEKAPDDRYQTGVELFKTLSDANEREEENYWEELYNEALALLNEKEYAHALEKWEVIRRALPDYRDVQEQVLRTEQYLDWNYELKRLLGDYDKWISSVENFLQEANFFVGTEKLRKLLKPKEISQKLAQDLKPKVVFRETLPWWVIPTMVIMAIVLLFTINYSYRYFQEPEIITIVKTVIVEKVVEKLVTVTP